MRTVFISTLFFFIFVCCSGVSVFAEGKEASLSHPETESTQEVIAKGTFEAKAAVPEGFDKTVLINFTSSGRQNIMARLDKMNGYVSSQEVHAGTYEVDFINIVGENARDYNLNAPDQIEILEGGVTRFQFDVSPKPTARKPDIKTETKTESIQPVQRSTVSFNRPVPDPELGSPAAGSADAHKPVIPDPEIEASDAAEIEKASTKAALQGSTVTTFISIGMLLLIVLLFYLYKQVIYKHDYYDC